MAIFSCLVGVAGASIDAINTKALAGHLQEVEDYLASGTSFSDRRVYRDCPEATRTEIYALLEKKGAVLSGQASTDPAQQKEYETQLDFFNAAELMFNFFFPVGAEVPTVRKFWGVLKTIITVSRPTISFETNMDNY